MKIAIVGFARFGQLWADLMKQFGQVMVFNRSDKADLAQGMEFYTFDRLDKIQEADYIFCCVAMSATLETLERIKPFVKDGVVVMDVCSVKVLPCQWLEEVFGSEADRIEIMGTHPMFGPDSAKTGLTDKQMVLCPLNISQDKLDFVKGIFNELKLKIIQTTPQDHDRQTAYSLALVHYLGRGLDRLDLDSIYITTLGFDRLLEIHGNVVNDSQELFNDLEKLNPYAQAARQKLRQVLDDLETDLNG